MNRNTAFATTKQHNYDQERTLTWELLIGYAFVWGYVLVGAAILMKLENNSPHRQPPPDIPGTVYELLDGTNYTVPAPPPVDAQGRLYLYYPQLTFLDAVYWVFVTLSTMGPLLSAPSSCALTKVTGFGDIFPTRNARHVDASPSLLTTTHAVSSRAFVFCWGLIGVSLVALLVVQVVTFVRSLHRWTPGLGAIQASQSKYPHTYTHTDVIEMRRFAYMLSTEAEGSIPPTF